MKSLHPAEWVSIALGLVLLVLVGMMVYRAWRASRITPEERERRRRAHLVAHGKMGDATLTEVREQFLFYAYLVRGVEYTASQDVSPLLERVPPDLSLLNAVSVRYDPRNPANSIVVAEDWTGLHLGELRRSQK
jgi:hypothetical protein